MIVRRDADGGGAARGRGVHWRRRRAAAGSGIAAAAWHCIMINGLYARARRGRRGVL